MQTLEPDSRLCPGVPYPRYEMGTLLVPSTELMHGYDAKNSKAYRKCSKCRLKKKMFEKPSHTQGVSHDEARIKTV